MIATPLLCSTSCSASPLQLPAQPLPPARRHGAAGFGRSRAHAARRPPARGHTPAPAGPTLQVPQHARRGRVGAGALCWRGRRPHLRGGRAGHASSARCALLPSSCTTPAQCSALPPCSSPAPRDLPHPLSSTLPPLLLPCRRPHPRSFWLRTPWRPPPAAWWPSRPCGGSMRWRGSGCVRVHACQLGGSARFQPCSGCTPS